MGRAKAFIDRIEETFIAILLGLMTVLTFANVLARYLFNSNIFYALELTVFMFAWLVLLGRILCGQEKCASGCGCCG